MGSPSRPAAYWPRAHEEDRGRREAVSASNMEIARIYLSEQLGDVLYIELRVDRTEITDLVDELENRALAVLEDLMHSAAEPLASPCFSSSRRDVETLTAQRPSIGTRDAVTRRR